MNVHPPRIEVSRHPMVIDSIAEQYDALLERADWINPYFSPEWMRSWWKRQKQDRAPLVLLAYSAEGELLGYWPFVERPGLLGSKGLWPFVYDEANYHFPTCVQSVAGPIVNALEGLIGSFLFIWLTTDPANLLECLPSGVRGKRRQVDHYPLCPFILPGGAGKRTKL